MGNVLIENNSFQHTFTLKYSSQSPAKRKSTNLNDLTLCGIGVNDYLRVSTSRRIAVAAGRVVDITKKTITLILERYFLVFLLIDFKYNLFIEI